MAQLNPIGLGLREVIAFVIVLIFRAGEWVAVSTVLYLAQRLISEYDTDPVVTKLVDHYDWFLLPVANPDGYEFSHTNDRMWRKTRSATSSSWGCKGVDPNRNFDFHWNGK